MKQLKKFLQSRVFDYITGGVFMLLLILCASIDCAENWKDYILGIIGCVAWLLIYGYKTGNLCLPGDLFEEEEE